MERKQSINYRRDRVIAKIDLSEPEHGAGATFFGGTIRSSWPRPLALIWRSQKQFAALSPKTNVTDDTGHVSPASRVLRVFSSPPCTG